MGALIVGVMMTVASAGRWEPASPLHLAVAAEKAGRWEQALDFYLRAYAIDRSAEVKERIRACLRTVAQLRRQRDPAFRQFVVSLSPAQALDLYAEAVGKLGANYVDRDKAVPARLFAYGLDELDRAMGEPAFRAEQFATASDLKVRAFRRALRDDWRLRLPSSAREARVAAFEIARDAQTQLGAKNPSAIVFELLCGACVGLDEHSAYHPPSALPDPGPMATISAVGVVAMRPGVGYLRIESFRDSTPREFDEAIDTLRTVGVRALIVDLRGNPGGKLTSAVQIAQRFLAGGIVVSTQGQSLEFADRIFSSDSGLAAFDIPLVLLVDGRTMSAAEAVAACWRDQNRATLIGVPTYGKGVVQAPVRLQALGDVTGSGVIVLTVATMASPRGIAIQGAGVTPHIIEIDAGKQFDLAVAKAAELAGMR